MFCTPLMILSLAVQLTFLTGCLITLLDGGLLFFGDYHV